jgi:hypothetical protein
VQGAFPGRSGRPVLARMMPVHATARRGRSEKRGRYLTDDGDLPSNEPNQIADLKSRNGCGSHQSGPPNPIGVCRSGANRAQQRQRDCWQQNRRPKALSQDQAGKEAEDSKGHDNRIRYGSLGSISKMLNLRQGHRF